MSAFHYIHFYWVRSDAGLPSDMNIPYMDPSAFEKKVLGPSKPSVSNHRTKCLGTTRDLNITVLLIFVAENRSSIA